MSLDLNIWLFLLLIVSPIITAITAKWLLPNFSFRQRLFIHLPQVILFSLGLFMSSISKSFFSNWLYLGLVSTFLGPAPGFILIHILFRKK